MQSKVDWSEVKVGDKVRFGATWYKVSEVDYSIMKFCVRSSSGRKDINLTEGNLRDCEEYKSIRKHETVIEKRYTI